MFQHQANQIITTHQKDSRLRLPGYGLPLDYFPVEKNIYGVESRSMFPSALDDRDIEDGYTDQPAQTLREIAMVEVMEALTDIPEWWKKVHDPKVAEEWKAQAFNSGRDISPNMADWIIEELRFKAMVYEQYQSVALYNGDVTKSDTNVPPELIKELQTAAKVLEYDEPELQFYNPGRLGRQRDLIAMALYPLVYGKSRILTDKVIGLDDALRHAGQGEVIPIPGDTGITREDMSWRVSERADIQVRPYSRNYQYLPSDWELGDDGRWRILTYINNLHPIKHRNLYKIIEDVFNCVIKQWNSTMTPLKDMLHSRTRIEYRKAEYYPLPKEILDQAPKIQGKEAQSEFELRYEEWRMEHYRAVQPDVGKFVPWAVPKSMMSKLPEDLPAAVRITRGVDLNTDYKERGLQVITRILGVDLTPENPDYQTDWHVEGQMNEHICAAGFLTFESENMEGAMMEFRNIVDTDTLDEVEHEPNDFVWLKQVYGLENGAPAVQQTGSIRSKIGRMIMFPSTIQHRMTRFQLKDKTKPGHTRMLVFFLVDPNIRIISTANIPPQRLDWTLDMKDDGNLKQAMAKAALENKDKKGNMPMSLSEALETRLDVLQTLIDFMRYQQVAFESRVLNL
ncbi:Protein of unknown function DUF4246 [Penicillium chermesinum]|uniref:Uncharacterized protein n=1 Tax=Penicillium chermesinum TaxID=63820 RepID=A0A9W9P8D0_9EURO|nr:Protein of unknown function DUF4246 [Penicillium chermesinum]KAJ5239411.1 Protein of unknown function DUF4246 [Penicillium chermesinum]KAJ6141330.1 Protein of unknown function DUF4246 [Penicillium chermesinum]